MKHLLFFFLFLYCGRVSAQHYSCVSPEYKTYFTNSRGYLRGMKIDSVRTIGGNTVHYPFLTARTNYMDWAGYADTTGGSWWGKQIVETPDSMSWMFNYSGDTVHIKRLANPGDSWVFFSDTSVIHYTAEVIAIDTQTIGADIDSVKVIRLTARDAGNIVVADSVNGIELRLSQHHGWVAAIDFYLFPYRRLATYAWPSEDTYFWEACGDSYSANRETLTFTRVAFRVPDYLEIFNFEPGYHYGSYERSNIENESVSHVVKNVITGKVTTDTSITYTMNFWRQTDVNPGFTGQPYTTYDSGFAQLQYYHDGLIMDTLYMPEQWYSGKERGNYVYYYPGDSSFCYRSAAYFLKADKIINNRYGGGGPEPSFPEVYYKTGIGKTWFSNGVFNPELVSTRGGIHVAGDANGWCNVQNATVGIKVPGETAVRLAIYPNPASGWLTVACADADEFSLQVIDVQGRIILYPVTYTNGSAKLDLARIPSGLYLLQVQTHAGRATRKIVVQH